MEAHDVDGAGSPGLDGREEVGVGNHRLELFSTSTASTTFTPMLIPRTGDRAPEQLVRPPQLPLQAFRDPPRQLPSHLGDHASPVLAHRSPKRQVGQHPDGDPHPPAVTVDVSRASALPRFLAPRAFAVGAPDAPPRLLRLASHRRETGARSGRASTPSVAPSNGFRPLTGVSSAPGHARHSCADVVQQRPRALGSGAHIELVRELHGRYEPLGRRQSKARVVVTAWDRLVLVSRDQLPVLHMVQYASTCGSMPKLTLQRTIRRPL